MKVLENKSKVEADRIPGTVIDSVSGYLKYVADHCTNYSPVLFRGHRVEDWPLIPKIARLPLRDGESLLLVEQSMLSEFKRRSLPYLEFQHRTDWDWLALAKHYGMATRLLDWTANPLAALWFAVEYPAMEQLRGTVWIFFTSTEDYVENPEQESPFKTDRTRVFRPNHLTRRIVAQDGWFTVHKYMDKKGKFIPLEKNKMYTGRISRVAIPHNRFASLRQELDRCGFNPASLYADLESLARHIEWKFSPIDDEE